MSDLLKVTELVSDRMELAGPEQETQGAESPQDEGFASPSGGRQPREQGTCRCWTSGRLTGLYQELLLGKLHV